MTDLPAAKTRPASTWSAIWILPLIALVIGAWLGWRAYTQAGVDIQVKFDTGEGIQVNKTEVIYKGMSIGRVTEMQLDDGGRRSGVIVTITMDKDMDSFRRAGTRFWLVKPSVTLAGVTGLETLVSGNYIGALPGNGEPRTVFSALDEPPPMPDWVPGLHLTLKANRLGSLSQGSPIFYRQIQVGRVKSYELAEDQKTLDIKAYIEPAYAQLVRKDTRFWNASGVSIDASLSGIKLRSESLASIVAGGIAFDTPDNREDSPPADGQTPYQLFDDYDAAQAGVKVNVKLGDFEGLQTGRTPVMYKGFQVGTLKDLKVDNNLQGATAVLTINPLMEEYLVEGADFWVVKPSISLAGITGLEALVKGNYIAMRPGDKGNVAKRDFEARSKAPPLDLNAPGLHLVLISDTLGSLDIGSPVLYRQVKVGTVQSYQFSPDSRHVVIGVHIEPNYARLVNTSTRFWNASGITLSGGLTSGVEVKSESLQSLLAGGISFETPDPKAPGARQIPSFQLHANREEALQGGTLVQIDLDDGEGLSPGSSIRYKGLEVGKVESLSLSDDLQSVVAQARISRAEQQIARKGTQFWVVKPELGLVRTDNLQTLVTGRYIAVQPSENGARQTRFTALGDAPSAVAREAGLRLTLSASRRGSIKIGVPVSYREIPVGKVVGYTLGPNADRVLIDILIEPRYARLVHSGSRFWNASGFNFDFGLIRGASVKTESVEALLEGGIAFATPDGEQMGKPAVPGQTFPLFGEANEEWLNWAPKIPVDGK